MMCSRMMIPEVAQTYTLKSRILGLVCQWTWCGWLARFLSGSQESRLELFCIQCKQRLLGSPQLISVPSIPCAPLGLSFGYSWECTPWRRLALSQGLWRPHEPELQRFSQLARARKPRRRRTVECRQVLARTSCSIWSWSLRSRLELRCIHSPNHSSRLLRFAPLGFLPLRNQRARWVSLLLSRKFQQPLLHLISEMSDRA